MHNKKVLSRLCAPHEVVLKITKSPLSRYYTSHGVYQVLSVPLLRGRQLTPPSFSTQSLCFILVGQLITGKNDTASQTELLIPTLRGRASIALKKSVE